MIKDLLGISVDGLIVPIVIDDNRKVLEIQSALKDAGFLVGAIRQPTVSKAIIRLIARLDVSLEDLETSCKLLQKYIKE